MDLPSNLSSNGSTLRAAALALACLGCAPPGGTIEGTVTFDGRPVTDGFVMMQPMDGNYRAAASVRIEGGRYRLDRVTPGEMRLTLENLSTEVAGAPTPVPAAAVGAPETFTVLPGTHALDISLRTADRSRP